MKWNKTVKFLALILTLAMILGMVPAMAAGEEAADSVYCNAVIYTVDDDNPTATALAIKGDRLVYVGTDAGVQAYVGPNTKVVDLKGLTVLPGLMDGHMHVGSLGEGLLTLDVFWKPKDVILSMVAEAAKAAKPGEWIQGSGWMNTVWEDSDYPTKEDLDAVAPDNPTILTRADGHMIWVNSKALELAGITKDTPNPQGGEILKNDKGEVWGCLTDTAGNAVEKLVPPFTVEQQRTALLSAQEQLFSYGLTSAMDAGISVGALENYKALYASGQLKLRTYPLMMLTGTTNEEADFIRNNKPGGMLYDNHMNLRAVKIISDGSLGARSAAMLEEYSDRPGYTGEYRFTDQEIHDVVKLAYDQGYQVCTHAIGDGADHQIIDAYEKVMQENPREDPRLRIEHFQILTMEDIDRALKLGILPSMQYIHATSDLLMAEDRIGPERIKGAYAWRTIIDKGGNIICGTDAPVEMVNPWHNFYAGVTRKNRSGEPEGGWYINEAITREEVLKSYTIWAAYGAFEEDLIGSLEAGKLADFVVIDRNIMTCPADDMKDTQALMTVSGGEVVYTRDLSTPTVMWNGTPVDFNQAPVVEPGTIYVPVDDMLTAMDAKQEAKDGTVGVTFKDQSVQLPVKDVGGVRYVGVRALCEALGYTVRWYPDGQCVSISWTK